MRSTAMVCGRYGLRSALFGNDKRNIVRRGESEKTVAFDEEFYQCCRRRTDTITESFEVFGWFVRQ